MYLQKQKVYKKVLDSASADVAAGDPEEKLGSAGLKFTVRQGKRLVEVPFFNEMILFDIPGFSFKSSRSANVTLVTKILILHYINRASGAGLTGEKVAYEDIPGLRHYLPVFARRVAKPLEAAFGFEPHTFLEAALSLGGRQEDYGNASATLFALPRVPITFVLWAGDQEFPPSLKALYDRSVTEYLSLEDITVLSRMASSRIINEARKIYRYEE